MFMLIHSMVHKRLDRAAENELAYTTDYNGFWLIHVKLSCSKSSQTACAEAMDRSAMTAL
jgi:hypothetical protein